MVLYQIGSASLDNLVGATPFISLDSLFIIYIVLAMAFSVTKNIITLWPIYWCIGSTVNTLGLGMHYKWDMVVVYAITLLIQLGFIYYFYKKYHSRSDISKSLP